MLLANITLYYPLHTMILNEKIALDFRSILKNKKSRPFLQFYTYLPFVLILLALLFYLLRVVFLYIKPQLSPLSFQIILYSVLVFILITLSYWTIKKLLAIQHFIIKFVQQLRFMQKAILSIQLFLLCSLLGETIFEALILSALFILLFYNLLFHCELQHLFTTSCVKRYYVMVGELVLVGILLFALKYLPVSDYTNVAVDVLKMHPTLFLAIYILLFILVSLPANFIQLKLLLSYFLPNNRTSTVIVAIWLLLFYLLLIALLIQNGLEQALLMFVYQSID